MLERPISNAGWTRVRFDQIATQINDRVDNPAEAGVDRYVGLEHLDPDSLRIRRWGEPTDVESTKLRFQPGDIIFGKRRVYQRKVAVADFEGICSAHAMVLRAKPGAVLPEFLPFFMQSDLFMERALSISVGSLSPTINWKALAAEEFLLPPIQEPVLDKDQRFVFCAAVDDNGYLPTHNAKFSKPQGDDPVWNAANCRNRRIFADKVGLAAGRNTMPFLLQTYRRDMGGGKFALMKDVSAPITLCGRHWGGVRLAYKV